MHGINHTIHLSVDIVSLLAGKHQAACFVSIPPPRGRLFGSKAFDQKADNPPGSERLPKSKMLAIDQYAETALSNRNYFLNRPHGIGGMKDDIP